MAACWLLAACGASGPHEAEWPPLARKWFDRASASYQHVDIEDASLAVDNALKLQPDRLEVRLLAARIALAKLDYSRVEELLRGVEGAEARSLRGRAYWYAGKVSEAADELEQLLADPDVRDSWAREVATLARRGAGREPFRTSGSLLAVTEMPRVGGTSLVVPLEVNGEPALGLIATGTAEAVIDSSTGRESGWISLRFDDRLEVHDVPAFAQDLSGLSRRLQAPVKLLIGMNLLRHLNPTFDFQGSQFVVRTFDPPPPPRTTTLRPSYVRGGGMVVQSGVGNAEDQSALALLVDTSLQAPVALDDAGWKKAGVDPSTLEAAPSGGAMRQGTLPVMRLGAFEIPGVPGLYGAPIEEFEKGLDVDLDGLLGSGLLAAFRVTLVDSGRRMWIDDNNLQLGAGPATPPEEGPGEQLGPDSPASGAEGGAEAPADAPARSPAG